jgi:hypothetical protein
MRESIIKLDGTRPFIPCSSGFAKLPPGFGGSWPDNKASGVYSSGPYTWQDSKLLAHQSAKVSLSSSDVKESFSLSGFMANSKEVNFVVLNLQDAKGKVISHNAYWLAADNNYTALQSMPRTAVTTTILKKEQVKTETGWSVKFTNNSKKLAFFVNPRLMKENDEMLPAYWSANYFHWPRSNPSPAK